MHSSGQKNFGLYWRLGRHHILQPFSHNIQLTHLLIYRQALCIANTGTSTLTTLLVEEGTSIPAFQTLFNYVLLFLIYHTWTLYKYGWKKYFNLLKVDGWKYIICSFLDSQGNYFTVLAYRYTSILSCQLLNFWSIVCVVIVSFTFLKVRYRWAQIIGIILCCGGMGILLASDHITGSNGGYFPEQIKGDMFALAGATCYGLSNVFEEWFFSKRPMYEVLGQLGLWGMFWNGGDCGIFDRHWMQIAVWNSKVIGYVAGYTLLLTFFYSGAPFILRMSSAAFFDISLLTGNFWGVAIGIKVFHYSIYWMYPIAFVLIIIGLLVYFLGGSVLADSKKPWLGENQEGGHAGWGTAKARAIAAAEKDNQRVHQA